VDAVTIREILCKSALVKSGISDYALNPYTGCEHRCVYCYASFMARFSRHDAPWGQWVDVKVNVADVLARDLTRLARRKDAHDPVEAVVSSVTDAYQPAERVYGLTRACLEVIAGVRRAIPLKVSILTKSDLVLRDVDVLRDIPGVDVGMTVTSDDDAVTARYEPGASPATKRLSALRRLSGSGLSTWAFISPVLPYHSDSEESLGRLLGKLQDTGVSRVMVDRFNPYPASVSRFVKVAPTEAARALREYTDRPYEYLDRLRETIEQQAERVGLNVEILFDRLI
jgi:DNA repair photolyase